MPISAGHRGGTVGCLVRHASPTTRDAGNGHCQAKGGVPCTARFGRGSAGILAVVLAVLLAGCGGKSAVTAPPDSGRPTGELMSVPLPGGGVLRLVWVAPATFAMGSAADELFGWPDEQPRHTVTLTQGFWLGQCEVTQAQWQAVMLTAPWVGQEHVQADSSNPAVYVSWDDAQRFVQGLNQVTADTLFRLPTEAEWEFACRAGTQTEWSFGNSDLSLANYAWYYDNAWSAGHEAAQPAMSRQPNPWGLYDMHGNVSEWVQDWYGAYADGGVSDPRGPAQGSYRVVRGGAFCNYYRLTRSAFRDYGTPATGYRDVGLRVVKTETASGR